MAVSRPLATSQTRTAVSGDTAMFAATVTTRVPSGLKAAKYTALPSPLSNAISSPLAVSRIRTAPSGSAIKRRFPSGLNMTPITSPSSYSVVMS